MLVIIIEGSFREQNKTISSTGELIEIDKILNPMQFPSIEEWNAYIKGRNEHRLHSIKNYIITDRNKLFHYIKHN